MPTKRKRPTMAEITRLQAREKELLVEVEKGNNAYLAKSALLDQLEQRLTTASANAAAALAVERGLRARIEKLELSVKHLRVDREGLLTTIRALSEEHDLASGRSVRILD